MTPFSKLSHASRIDNPAIKATRACLEANGYVVRPITTALLNEVSVALTKACRVPCVAFHEVDLVPTVMACSPSRRRHTSRP